MGNNSLQNYNKNLSPFTGAGTPANNFNRNHEATSVNRPGGLYMRYNNSNSIFGNYYSKDPITNFGDISYSNKKSAGEIITTIFAGLTGALGLVGTVASIVSLFQQNKQTNGVNNGFTRKESKEIKRNTENTTDINTAIDSTIETAQNLDENASVDTLMKASENLRNSITQATNQNVENNVITASAEEIQGLKVEVETLKGDSKLNNDSTLYEGEYLKYNVKITNTLDKDINNVKVVGSIPEGLTYGELNADYYSYNGIYEYKFDENLREKEITIDKISAGETVTKFYEVKVNDLVDDVEKQIQKSDEKLQKLEKEIQVQQKIITNNTEVVNILESKILTANQLYEDLNKKIEEQNK